jgi:hypothetical protein
MDLDGEDTNIEPERTKFIRATAHKWEQEWLAEEGNKVSHYRIFCGIDFPPLESIK